MIVSICCALLNHDGTTPTALFSVVCAVLDFNVIDQPRPRTVGADDMSVNHGDIVIVAATNVALSSFVIVDQPTSYEMVCVRVVGCFAAVVVVVYRLGSVSVQQLFFDKLAAVLDCIATHQEPIYVVSDLNVRLDRPDDQHADQFRLLVDCYGFKLHATGPTHHLGVTLDTVITRETTGCPDCVAVEDVGLTDQRLLGWAVNTTQSTPAIATVRVAIWIWSFLDLSTTRLCHPDRHR